MATMLLSDFARKYRDKLNVTPAAIYLYVKEHADELEQAGAIQIVDKLKRVSIIVKDDQKLLQFIFSRTKRRKPVTA